MTAGIPATQLAERIQQLLDERQEHSDAIAVIDETLAGVGAALGSVTTGSTHRNGKKAAARATVDKTPGTKKKRGGFAVSAEESILAFVKQQRNPTTAEVNEHFRSEGRKSTADNALGKLVGENKLQRLPLGEGIRGSRYTLA